MDQAGSSTNINVDTQELLSDIRKQKEHYKELLAKLDSLDTQLKESIVSNDQENLKKIQKKIKGS